MSFATLSNTIEDCSAISALEVTKNPFDSGVDGRLHMPSLSSPSIFLQQNTPGSQKKKGFRWSIDQISKLDPADIEEFPNQEYSSTCDRQEDEEKVQEAINEYFSRGTILPSPWTPESHIKHVTFSPHPPSTTYISGDEDSMADASNTSSAGNTSGRVHSVDACCQTSLTFPPSFDLSKIVDSGLYSYVEEEGNSASRDLNVSSLRRKLFSPDENNSPMISRQPPRPRVTRSILKSPSPLNLLTSSPMQHRKTKDHSDSNSPLSNASNGTSQSPAISPIKATHTTTPNKSFPQGVSHLHLEGTESGDEVFNSEVFESSDVCIDPQLTPDVSPIKAAHDTNTSGPNEAGHNLGDVGPMRISELSHMTMEFEEENQSSIAMDITDHQPLTSTQHKKPISSSPKTHDVIGDDVMTDDVIHDDGVIVADEIDAMHENNDDITDGEFRGVAARNRGTYWVRDVSNTSEVFERLMDTKGYPTVEVDSWESKKENLDVNQMGQRGVSRDNNGDEVLVQRACAAMKRADRLVRESNLEQGMANNRRTCTNMGLSNFSHMDKHWKHVSKSQYHVDKTWNHVNKLWHPIDMSTPLVNDNPKNKLLDTQNVDSRVRRPLLDPDSYCNLLSSFANSNLEQCPRTYTPAANEFGLSQNGTCDGRAVNQVLNKSPGTRSDRRLSDSGKNTALSAHMSTQEAYLSGRFGYSVSFGKRVSWPPWQSWRNRQRYLGLGERGSTPLVPCSLSRSRRRSAEDRPRTFRSTSEDLKRFSRTSQPRPQKTKEEYLSVLHADLRRDFRA